MLLTDYPAVNTVLIITALIPVIITCCVYLWRSAVAKGEEIQWRKEITHRLDRIEHKLEINGD